MIIIIIVILLFANALWTFNYNVIKIFSDKKRTGKLIEIIISDRHSL